MSYLCLSFLGRAYERPLPAVFSTIRVRSGEIQFFILLLACNFQQRSPLSNLPPYRFTANVALTLIRSCSYSVQCGVSGFTLSNAFLQPSITALGDTSDPLRPFGLHIFLSLCVTVACRPVTSQVKVLQDGGALATKRRFGMMFIQF